MQLISRGALLIGPKVLGRNEADLLRAGLRRDAESWSPDSPSLFNTDIMRDESSGETINVTPDTLRLDPGVHSLTRDNAKTVREVLETGGIKTEIGIPLKPVPPAGSSQLHSMQLTLSDLLIRELFSDTNLHDRQ